MKNTEMINDDFTVEDFDFTSLPNYVESLKKKFGLNEDESALFFWLIEMYDKKRFTPPRYTF